jgi:hypothetical protein
MVSEPRRLKSPKVVAELTLLLYILKVPYSNLGSETGYHEVYRGFPESPQVDAGIIS